MTAPRQRDLTHCAPCRRKMLRAVRAASTVVPDTLPILTLCLNVHNEGADVAATVASFREHWPGPFKCLVYADATTDGSLDGLPDDCRIIPSETRVGCGQAKDALAFSAEGVALYTDGHCRVLEPRAFVEAVCLAARERAVVIPGVAPLKCGPAEQPAPDHPIARVSWGAAMPVEPIGVDQREVHRHSGAKPVEAFERRECGYGTYLISGPTLERIGGWNRYPGTWGSQEIGLALRCWFSDTPILAARDFIVGHRYKKRANYSHYGHADKANHRYAHRVVFDPETVAETWQPVWDTLSATKRGEALLAASDIEDQAGHFAEACKRRTDAEFFATFYPGGRPVEPLPTDQITAILLSYRRPRGIQSAVDALRAYGFENVWVWRNGPDAPEPSGATRVFTDSANGRTWPRYAVAGLVETPWVLFLDDDIELRAKGLDALRIEAARNPRATYGLHGMRLKPPFDEYEHRSIFQSHKVAAPERVDMLWPKGQLIPRDAARDAYARRDLWDTMRASVRSTSGDDLTAAVALGLLGVESYVVPTDGRAWVEHEEETRHALSAQPGRMKRKRSTIAQFRSLGWRPVAAPPDDAAAEIRLRLDAIPEVKTKQIPEELRQAVAVVATHRPETYVEIGSAYGGSLLAYARACAPGAKVIAVDIGRTMKRRVGLRAAVAQLKREGYDVHWVRGYSHEVTDRVRALLGREPIDFLHIDADHAADSVRRDWNTYRPMLAPDFLAAFHDVVHPGVGVAEAWAEISAETGMSSVTVDARTAEVVNGIGLLWPASPLTVYTPFGPGRPWCVDLWRASVAVAHPPAGSRLVVFDDTGDPAIHDRLLATSNDLAEEIEGTAVVLRNEDPPLDHPRNPATSERMAALWRSAASAFQGGGILSLEADVMAPPRACERLARAVHNRDDVYAVAAACRSRRPDRHEMAYRLDSLDPWRLGPSLEPGDGVQQVGSVHTGCTLIRARQFFETRPRVAPDNAPAGDVGCDKAICQDLQRLGGRILVDWTARANHHLSPTESV